MSDESIKEPHVRALAEYIDSELADIYAVDVVSVGAVCVISYHVISYRITCCLASLALFFVHPC